MFALTKIKAVLAMLLTVASFSLVMFPAQVSAHTANQHWNQSKLVWVDDRCGGPDANFDIYIYTGNLRTGTGLELCAAVKDLNKWSVGDSTTLDWNDETSSAQVVSAGPSTCLQLYQYPDYGGNSIILYDLDHVDYMTDYNFNNKTSSLHSTCNPF
jgi:hypothetical protein